MIRIELPAPGSLAALVPPFDEAAGLVDRRVDLALEAVERVDGQQRAPDPGKRAWTQGAERLVVQRLLGDGVNPVGGLGEERGVALVPAVIF